MNFTGKHGFAGLVVALAFVSQASAGETISVEYDVSFGGSRIMKASYSANVDGDSYAAKMNARTVGVSKMFSKIKLNLSAQGQLTKGGLQPVSYNYVRKKNDKTKQRQLSFNGDGRLKTDGAGYDETIVAAVKKDLMDPLSMLLKLGRSAKPCSGKHRAFDGRDVFDLSLSSSSNDGGKLTCKMVYTPVAGDDVVDGDTAPKKYEIVLVPTGSTQAYVAVQINGSTQGVSFDVSATSVVVNGTPLTY